MVQNALDQSDRRTFKSTISLGENEETARFFSCWYKFIDVKSWLKNIGVGVAVNGVPTVVAGFLME